MKHWPLKFALFLNFLVLALLLNSVGAVALHVQRAYGISASAAGSLALCKSLGIVGASFGAALFLAAIGYRRAMLIALGALALACALVPVFPDLTMLRLLFVVAGASFAVIKVSVYATIGLIARDEREYASLLSLLEAIFPVGIVLGSLLFGALTNDTEPASGDWLRVFYFLAAASAAAGLILASVSIDEKALRPAPASLRERFAAATHLRATPGVLVFGACIFLYVMLEQSTLNWLPTFNTRVLHLPPSLGIQLAGALTIAVVAGRIAAGGILRRVRWFPLLLGGLAVAAGLVIFALFAIDRDHAAPAGMRDLPFVAFSIPAIGFFLAPIYPTLNSAMLSRVPLAHQGTISSWGVMVSAAGSSIGTLIVGFLFERHGARTALLSALVPMVALAGGLCWFNVRTRKSHS